MSLNKKIIQQQQNSQKLYIYAEVDIDRAYSQIILKSKKVKTFLQQHSLGSQFTEKIRQYKNFRIVFDNQIQKFIRKKQLNPDLRIIKKQVFNPLQDFIISRYIIYLEEKRLQQEYRNKVEEIQNKFIKRLKDLTIKVIQDNQDN